MSDIKISVAAGPTVKPVRRWDKSTTNLEQYRALMALDAASLIEKGTGGGQMVAKKVATQIRENGFLGALAFAIEPKKDGGFKNLGHQSVFEAIRQYLVGIEAVKRSGDTGALMQEVAGGTTDALRYISGETIAYMSYLRRFAKPDKEGVSEES